jgi:uncharacterized membrane protein YtjA (UPF0391 family)
MKHRMMRTFVALLAVSLGMSGMISTASATVVGTRTVMLQAERADSLARVHAALDREAVQQQLVSYGVDVEAAKARIASLSDAELRQLDGRLATLPAGAGIVEIVGVVFVVLLILELVGVIDIFKAF